MDESGYIKLFRSIQENDLWYSEPFTKAQAWVDILLSANFKDGGFYVRGVWVDVKRGQCARSEITMSILWKWSRNKVRRYLDSLRKREMVTLERNNKTTLITICNYDSFQSQKTVHDTPNDTPNDTPERHQKDTKRYTNNKEKKDKNEKKREKPVSVLKPEEVTEQTWEDFLTHRKTKKAPVTITALKGFITEANKAGFTLEDALKETMRMGWQGFNSEWVKKKKTNYTMEVYGEDVA